jgi:hypothetical protein
MYQHGGLQAIQQLYGDCYAHVSTTVILKLLKTLEIIEDVRNTDGKNDKYISDLALLDKTEKDYVAASIKYSKDLNLSNAKVKLWNTFNTNHGKPARASINELFDKMKNKSFVVPDAEIQKLQTQIQSAIDSLNELRLEFNFNNPPGEGEDKSEPQVINDIPPKETDDDDDETANTGSITENVSDNDDVVVKTLDELIAEYETKLGDKFMTKVVEQNKNPSVEEIDVLNAIINKLNELDELDDDDEDKYDNFYTKIEELQNALEKQAGGGGGGGGGNTFDLNKIDLMKYKSSRNELIDYLTIIYNTLVGSEIHDQLDKLKPGSIEESPSVITRKKIVGVIDEDGNITQDVDNPDKNEEIAGILAKQTKYYRQLYLYIIRFCGVNGGDVSKVFNWLVEQVNSLKPTIQLCNFETDKEKILRDLYDKGDKLHDKLTNQGFIAENDSFIKTNVVDAIKDKLKARQQKLQSVTIKYYEDEENKLTKPKLELIKYFNSDEYSTSDSKYYLYNKDRTTNLEQNFDALWAELEKIKEKKLYAMLGINSNGPNGEKTFANFTDINNNPTNHAVTITDIGTGDDGKKFIKIKNSWGIQDGEFGKQKLPFDSFGYDKRFGNFDVAYIDIVATVATVATVAKGGGARKTHSKRKKIRRKSKKKSNK